MRARADSASRRRRAALRSGQIPLLGYNSHASISSKAPSGARSHHSFRRRRHAAVAAVARVRAEAVHAAARRRDAARQDDRARGRAARRRGVDHRHQSRLLLPHQGRLRRRGRSPPPHVVYLLEPFGRNTAAAVALAALMRAGEHRRRRDAAGAARRSSDSRRQRVRRRRRARRIARAQGMAGDVRHRPDAPGDRLRLHRMRRGARRSRARFASTASSKSRRSPTRRNYVATGRYVWNSGMFCFTAGGDSRSLRAARAGGARRGAPRLAERWRRKANCDDAGDRSRAVRGGARHLDRLRGHGKGRPMSPSCAARSTGATSGRGRRSRR